MGNNTGLPCPHPECSSSDAFSYNTEMLAGHCFSCGNKYPAKGTTYEDWVYEEYPLKFTPNQKEIKPVENHQVLVPVYRGYRGLTEVTVKKYKVQNYLDDKGEPKEVHYIYPNGGEKVRTFPKQFKTLKGFKSDDLFGRDLFAPNSAQVVTVTEGEEDAMSVWQMMGDYPVVSLPSSTPSKEIWRGKAREWLDSFDKIVLAVDNDESGDGVADRMAKLFPNKIYRVNMTEFKDANEYLTNGKTKEFSKLWWGAQKYVPENIWNTPEQFLTIYHEETDSAYVPTGIQDLDDVILGLMQGHFTVFQAPEGIGKTEFMRFLEYNLINNHPDIPIAISHSEETKKRSMLGLVSYRLKENVTRKDLIDDKGLTTKVEDVIIDLTKSENVYQFVMGVDDDPNELLDKIRFFSQACGCKYIFFEPIQDLAYSKTGDDTVEGFLSKLSTKLARLAAELNVGIITIAHENDDGQIRDCRMIGKRASVVVKLSRDKMSDDEDQRNTTDLLVVKNRPAGTTGFAGHLAFDGESFTLKEKYGGM